MSGPHRGVAEISKEGLLFVFDRVTGQPVFPTAVSPKYAKESAGIARRHTCLDQYRENKATNSNAGLNWIQKGGGYYSECAKRLKG